MNMVVWFGNCSNDCHQSLLHCLCSGKIAICHRKPCLSKDNQPQSWFTVIKMKHSVLLMSLENIKKLEDKTNSGVFTSKFNLYDDE